MSRATLVTAKNRLIISCVTYFILMLILIIRLFYVMVFNITSDSSGGSFQTPHYHTGRANIIDRHGHILASTITTNSLYANAKKIIDAKRTADQLITVLPTLNRKSLIQKLQSDKQFVWLIRHLTPLQQEKILELGLPGIDFMPDQRRIYPYGALTSHITGLTDIDNQGISGIEKSYNQQLLTQGDPLQLSIDMKIQYAVKDSLQQGLKEFSADAGAAVVMDLKTNEIVALVSLPDFDPNKTVNIQDRSFFNIITSGMYEMGSTLKIINTAMVLDCGAAKMSSLFDTSAVLRVGRFTITDYRANHGVINVADIFVHSSNKGSARMALAAGTENQKNFFKKVGLLERNKLELPEFGKPLLPKHWREVNTITMSYGYGLAISPLHLLNAVASIVGGGCRKQATLTYQPRTDTPCQRVVSPQTSQTMVQLMRLVATEGTSRKANMPGFFVGAKTGTRNLLMNGRYQKDRVATSFVAIMGENQNEPRYIVVVLLENPHRTPRTYGFNTAGWNAAPVGGAILARIAALTGMKPTATPDRVTDPFFLNRQVKLHP